jgi:hypothetical protein
MISAKLVLSEREGSAELGAEHFAKLKAAFAPRLG